MKVFFQNRIVDEKDARVSVFDHGFLYGDGIYETVRAYNYRVFHWPAHYRRLKQSARRIELQCPWSSGFLLNGIRRTLRANQSANASVRITVSRGPGSLGLDPSVCPRPTLALLLHPERDAEKFHRLGVSIGIPKVRRNHPKCLDPQIKSNNQLNTILAKIEGRKMTVFETVLLNLEGYLTEGTTSNIFFVENRALHTPALSCGLLEGVTRGAVMKLARQAKIPVREGHYTPAHLLRADEAFLTSSTLEVVPVVRVRNGSVSRKIASGQPGPITRQLHQLLRFAIIRGI